MPRLEFVVTKATTEEVAKGFDAHSSFPIAPCLPDGRVIKDTGLPPIREICGWVLKLLLAKVVDYFLFNGQSVSRATTRLANGLKWRKTFHPA